MTSSSTWECMPSILPNACLHVNVVNRPPQISLLPCRSLQAGLTSLATQITLIAGSVRRLGEEPKEEGRAPPGVSGFVGGVALARTGQGEGGSRFGPWGCLGARS